LESAYVVHPEAKRIENAQVSIAELRTVMVAEDAAWMPLGCRPRKFGWMASTPATISSRSYLHEARDSRRPTRNCAVWMGFVAVAVSLGNAGVR
jgi:hypothetical protein